MHSSQFELYFSSIHRLLQVDHPDFDHMHVIGDLTYIKPNASFSGFTSRSTIEIPLVYEFWSVQNTDKMPVSSHFIVSLLLLLLLLLGIICSHLHIVNNCCWCLYPRGGLLQWGVQLPSSTIQILKIWKVL